MPTGFAIFNDKNQLLEANDVLFEQSGIDLGSLVGERIETVVSALQN